MTSDYDFNPLPQWSYYVNANLSVVGFVISVCMLFHVIFEWIWKPKYGSKDSKNEANLDMKMVYGAIIVMLTATLLFTVYCIEFFFFRIFGGNNAYILCELLTPLLFISVGLLVYAVLYYFTIRLESSFKNSSLEFGRHFFMKLRSFYFVLLLFCCVFVACMVKGVPYSLSTNSVTNNGPWLCRNCVKWELFWPFVNLFTLLAVVGVNMINCFLFVQKLTALLELSLKNDPVFINDYMTPKHNNNSSSDFQFNGKHNNNNNLQVIDEQQNDNIKDLRLPDDDDDDDHARPDYDTDTTYESHPLSPNIPNVEHRSKHRKHSSSQGSISSIGDLIHKGKAKLQQNKEERIQRDQKRSKRNKRLFKLIKKQTILTAIVTISTIIFWTVQTAFESGSILILCDMICNLICVYLSFGFTSKLYLCCCGKCMNDLTCIEDCIERKIAKHLSEQKKNAQTDGERRHLNAIN